MLFLKALYKSMRFFLLTYLTVVMMIIIIIFNVVPVDMLRNVTTSVPKFYYFQANANQRKGRAGRTGPG